MELETFIHIPHGSTETTEILGTYTEAQLTALAAEMLDPACHGGASGSGLIVWRGRAFGRDTFEIVYYSGWCRAIWVPGSGQRLYAKEVTFDLGLDLDARDRERAALAAAHRAAGVTVSLGGAR